MHLVDLPAFYPPHHGGVESYTHELHRRLLQADPDLRITVLASAIGAAPGVEQLSERWRIVRWAASEPVSHYPVPARGFNRLLREHCSPGSVLMTHTRFYLHASIAGRFARARGLGWVHVEHGSSAVRSGAGPVRTVAHAVDRTMGRQILRRADEVVAVSDSAAAFVAELAGRVATVLHRGIEPPEGMLGNPRADPPVACFVGRLVDAKGVADLVAATHILHRQGVRLKLRLCGEGPERAALVARVAALKLTEHVEFLGALPHQQALAEMADATVFVNPSWTEGLPTTVLEAAALGAAVVATNVGGTAEIVTDGATGWLVPPRNPAALASALATALGDADRREAVAGRLRNTSLERFSWARTLDGFGELFTRVAGQ